MCIYHKPCRQLYQRERLQICKRISQETKVLILSTCISMAKILECFKRAYLLKCWLTNISREDEEINAFGRCGKCV